MDSPNFAVSVDNAVPIHAVLSLQRAGFFDEIDQGDLSRIFSRYVFRNVSEDSANIASVYRKSVGK
jgi:hypothetical protein